MAPPRPTEVSHVDDAIVDDIAIAADEEEEEATSSSREEEELGARVPSLQHPRRREAFDEKLHPRATYSGTQDLGVGGSIVLPHQIVEQQHATLRKIKEQQRQHAEGAGSQAAGGTGGGVPNRTPLPYPVGDSGLFVGRPATTVRPPGPFGRRLTSNTTEPSVRLSIDGVSPVHYGGIVYETSIPKAILALSKKDWPAWTLLHSTNFEIDLDLLDRRLWHEEKVLGIREPQPLASSTSKMDILLLVSRRRNGTLFPDSQEMMQKKQVEGGSLALVRSSTLKSATHGARLKAMKMPATGSSAQQVSMGAASLEMAIDLAVRQSPVKVLEAFDGHGGAVGNERVV